MTALPFEHDSSVRDAAPFRAKTYEQGFMAKSRACLRRSKPVYDRAPSNTDYDSIFCGELIFLFARTPDGFRFTDIGMND